MQRIGDFTSGNYGLREFSLKAARNIQYRGLYLREGIEVAKDEGSKD
jgi:hypothetical protein